MATGDEQNKIILYQDENGVTKVSVRFSSLDPNPTYKKFLLVRTEGKR